MVEAAVSLPIIILSVMLMLRIFVFYLDILNTGIREHEKAMEAWDLYSGKGMHEYETIEEVYMLKGGMLRSDLKKTIISKAWFFNEDSIVRAGE